VEKVMVAEPWITPFIVSHSIYEQLIELFHGLSPYRVHSSYFIPFLLTGIG
jgi:hypothetical protein